MNNRFAAADHVRRYCLSVNTPSDSRVEADVGAGVAPRSSERSAGVLLPWVISEDGAEERCPAGCYAHERV